MERQFKVEEMWAKYAAHCLPPAAGQNQVQGTHMAFWAGFISMHEICQFIGQPQVSSEEGVLILDDLKKQIDAFMAKMRPPQPSHPRSQ